MAGPRAAGDGGGAARSGSADSAAGRSTAGKLEGNHGATLLDEETTHGPLTVSTLLELEAGGVKEVRVFYDPRQILDRTED